MKHKTWSEKIDNGQGDRICECCGSAYYSGFCPGDSRTPTTYSHDCPKCERKDSLKLLFKCKRFHTSAQTRFSNRIDQVLTKIGGNHV